MPRTNYDKFLIPETLPMWFQISAPDSNINSRDVAKLFGYKSMTSLSKCVFYGSFPLPDHRKGHNGNMMWKKSTLLREIERRKSLKNAQTNGKT